MADIQTARQAGKFGIVGALNTLIDFSIYNLNHIVFGLGLVTSNLISTTAAMLFSFAVNRRYVFDPGEQHIARQAATFLAVTAFGLYVIQTGLIYLLDTYVFHNSGIVFTNLAKAIATCGSLAWNFVMYKKVVFQ